MRLTWAQIAINARHFAAKWKDASYERGESQSFYNEFFLVFGVERRSVARYEEHVRKLGNRSGFIDLFWPGVLLVEHKSAGRSLKIAADEAGEYFDALDEDQRPRYQLVCDFQKFELLDRETGEQIAFPLVKLHENVQAFSFILGRQKQVYRVREPVNLKASKLVGNLHEILQVSRYPDKTLDQLLVRLVFCMFADNTGIFQPRGIFLDYIASATAQDGSDLGSTLATVFQILNQRGKDRQGTISDDLSQFPYINGDLFAGPIQIPHCTKVFREKLLEACGFDWSKISPAIFGALFQSILTPETRRRLGGHFTSETNILKVTEELFVKDLRARLADVKSEGGTRVQKARALRSFLIRLSRLTFFDPACGCGNFLAIAYREVRRLEIDALLELRKHERLDLDSLDLSQVDVDQFFGIEKHPYSARIAETALWMTDHLLNTDLSLQLGTVYQRVPLRKSPHIKVGDALEIEWDGVLPANRCSFVLGNPPYKGAKLQDEKERLQIRRLAKLGGSGGTLDYVCGWLLKAAKYADHTTRIAIVATNSIVRGEQVAQLWPTILDKLALEVAFAHQPFLWKVDNQDAPTVTVIVVGLDSRRSARNLKSLYTYSGDDDPPTRSEHRRISPYLIPGDNLANSHVVVREVGRPINGFRRLRTGTKPIDGGYYIFSKEQKADFLAKEPAAANLFRPFVGTTEFLYGEERYILFLPDSMEGEFSGLQEVRQAIDNVRNFRLARLASRNGGPSLKKANELFRTPRKFHITVVPSAPFLVIPEVTTERREYVPIAWLYPPTIPSNLVKVLLDATLTDFSFLTSAMHMAWLRTIGGRLDNRLRYSIGLVYNNFPLPSDYDSSHIESAAQHILDTRHNHSSQSLEKLYDPHLMPSELVAAHRRLDRVIDRMYRAKPFLDDNDRVEHLLGRYERLAGA